MTLRELVEDLTNKENLQLTIKSSAGRELISLKASGYEALEDDIETSDVTSWSIDMAAGSRGIVATLNYPQTTEAR